MPESKEHTGPEMKCALCQRPIRDEAGASAGVCPDCLARSQEWLQSQSAGLGAHLERQVWGALALACGWDSILQKGLPSRLRSGADSQESRDALLEYAFATHQRAIALHSGLETEESLPESPGEDESEVL